jgi:hypothetical protein
MHWKLVVHCASEQLRVVWVTTCLRKPHILSARARTSAAASIGERMVEAQEILVRFIPDEVVGFDAARQQEDGHDGDGEGRVPIHGREYPD